VRVLGQGFWVQTPTTHCWDIREVSRWTRVFLVLPEPLICGFLSPELAPRHVAFAEGVLVTRSWLFARRRTLPEP